MQGLLDSRELSVCVGSSTLEQNLSALLLEHSTYFVYLYYTSLQRLKSTD